MGFVKFQKGQASQHVHAYAPQPGSDKKVCFCGAVEPAAEKKP